jgi:hypothetical protein
MNPWQAIFFGSKQIPRELTAFEIEAFFIKQLASRCHQMIATDSGAFPEVANTNGNAAAMLSERSP